MSVARFVVLVFTILLFAAGPASAAPALWVVEAGDAKVYLFGTVHVMKPDATWHTPVLDAAIAESADAWLEVEDPDDVAAVVPLLRELGIDAAHPLSTKLSKADLARVDEAVKSIGAPGEAAFETFRPWLVSMTISTIPLQRAGYDPKSGIDLGIKHVFDAAKKPVHGFETLSQQMHLFADVTPEQEIAMLDATLDQIGALPTALNSLVSMWLSGDMDRFTAVTQSTSFRGSPEMYERLVVRRNTDWALQLHRRMQTRGVSFVAVGAAHLAGPDSVQSHLEKMGYRIKRVQ